MAWLEKAMKEADHKMQRKVGLENVLPVFIKCGHNIIKRERIVITGCNEVSELASRALRKLGYNPKVYSAFVDSKPEERRVAHTWVEVDNYVIETNPTQTFGISRYMAQMPIENWESFTHPSTREINPQAKSLVLTKAGEKYYNKLSDELVKCTQERM